MLCKFVGSAHVSQASRISAVGCFRWTNLWRGQCCAERVRQRTKLGSCYSWSFWLKIRERIRQKVTVIKQQSQVNLVTISQPKFSDCCLILFTASVAHCFALIILFVLSILLAWLGFLVIIAVVVVKSNSFTWDLMPSKGTNQCIFYVLLYITQGTIIWQSCNALRPLFIAI